jgi:Uma2 family endonuclease
MNQLVSSRFFEDARPHLISADEFDVMVDAGLFQDARIELVEGELVEMSPSSNPHGMLVGRLTGRIWNAYGEEDWVHYVDTYVTLAPKTVRAPDIAVVAREDFGVKMLTGADVLLAVEVSHSTLREDLQRKRLHYATAGIRNYWVVDVDGECVHCFTEPQDGDYTVKSRHGFADAIALPGIAATLTVA